MAEDRGQRSDVRSQMSEGKGLGRILRNGRLVQEFHIYI
jgi:hypothetical protein